VTAGRCTKKACNNGDDEKGEEEQHQQRLQGSPFQERFEPSRARQLDPLLHAAPQLTCG
jgi:hypothetical protein